MFLIRCKITMIFSIKTQNLYHILIDLLHYSRKMKKMIYLTAKKLNLEEINYTICSRNYGCWRKCSRD